MPNCMVCVYYIFVVMTLTMLRCTGTNDIEHSESGENIEKIHGYQSAESSGDGSYIHFIQNKVSQTDNGFIASLSMIIVTEIGDRTFLMVAVMAMRHPRALVFSGALASAVVMTALSALLGFATSIIPRYITHLASSVLFAVMGFKMFQEGWSMSPDEAEEEYEEIQEEIKKKTEERSTSGKDNETGVIKGTATDILTAISSAVFVETFLMTFFAEVGDRSQIATIVLAAREDVLDVMLGGSLGHVLCTGLAVLAGGLVAKKISARTVTFVGGVIFSIFAATGLFMGPD